MTRRTGLPLTKLQESRPRGWLQPLASGWRWVGALGLGILLGQTASAAPEDPRDLVQPKNRVILIKCDGLPPDLLAAVAQPERDDLLARLDYADDLRKAIREYRNLTGRALLLPNIRRFFFEDGVALENMYSHTLTLSAASWAVIDTGQPSIIKGQCTFSRDTGYLRSHLDGLRDTLDSLRRRPGYGDHKTSATWNLDQIGVSLMVDAFRPLRAWSGPQLFRRIANRDLLIDGGKNWLRGGGQGLGGIVRGHLSRQVTGIDYTVLNEDLNAMVTARKVLEKDLGGRERFDYLSPLFTNMDHQQHVDPHPANLVHSLVEIDQDVGRIFRAVAESERRDRTVVALASDHGLEIKPGQVGFSIPLTRIFREPLFGNHTVKTLLAESAWSAVSIVVPGSDWPRLYESRYSPYGQGNPKLGEKGWATAFIDPYGNGRAAVHLRNDDLNKLHLILIEMKNQPDPERFERLKELFRATLNKTRGWLEPDLALWEDYHSASRDLSANLMKKADGFSRDSSVRLREENERDAVPIRTLRKLLQISFEAGSDLFSDDSGKQDFEISEFIPKEYFGPPNSIRQLSNYTVGLDHKLEWVQTTVDHQGTPIPMNYFEIMDGYRSPVVPVNGIENPFDFIVSNGPLFATQQALRSAGVIDRSVRLADVAWIKSTGSKGAIRGGEALVVRATDDRILYLPIVDLEEQEDGTIRFRFGTTVDPLALLHDSAFEPGGDVVKRLEWLRSFHTPSEWRKATHKTEYSIAVTILIDLIGDPAPEFIRNPEFQEYLVNFSTPELKQQYLRGLTRKYANRFPDFTVWSNELWNFDSQSRTSGGNHAGLRPIVTRTAFLVWGGDDTGIARGRVVSDVHTTLDIAPTLFRAAGMLDDQNRVLRVRGSRPDRPFMPLPGRVVNVWLGDVPGTSNRR